MMVPLRVWLGAVWVFEGVMKIVEGWLQKPMLEGFFGGETVPHATLGNLLDRVLGDVTAIGATLGKQLISLVNHVLQGSTLSGSQFLAESSHVSILVGLDRSHVYTQLVLDEILIAGNEAEDADRARDGRAFGKNAVGSTRDVVTT